MTCKLVVNADSGNFCKLDVDKLLNALGCVDTEIETIDSQTDWSAEGYDTVIVCGGDGTLHNAIEKCRDTRLIYAPCGTLNETAHTDNPIVSLGKVNEQFFSYVCAAGSFTEIGYSAENKSKKKWKAIAYLPQVLKSFRSFEISAEIIANGKKIDGDFTLLMILKSYRCFGFPFNKSYKKRKGLYLVAIRSYGKDNAVNRAKMFFPFFRVFFCGVKKPTERKNWVLIPFDELTIRLKEPQTFCLDGEKRVLSGELRFGTHMLKRQIDVVKTPFVKRRTHRFDADKH